MRRLIRKFDIALTRLLASIPARYRPFAVLITNLGDPIVTISVGLAVAGAGFLQEDVWLMMSGAVIWVTLIVGAALKMLFGRRRPISARAVKLRFDTYSFPSGHSSGATITYGLLAYIGYSLLIQPYSIIIVTICCLLIFTIGLSRIYLGVHFPSDVVAGWALGMLAILYVVTTSTPLAV